MISRKPTGANDRGALRVANSQFWSSGARIAILGCIRHPLLPTIHVLSILPPVLPEIDDARGNGEPEKAQFLSSQRGRVSVQPGLARRKDLRHLKRGTTDSCAFSEISLGGGLTRRRCREGEAFLTPRLVLGTPGEHKLRASRGTIPPVADSEVVP